jgi:hypothetical protein
VLIGSINQLKSGTAITVPAILEALALPLKPKPLDLQLKMLYLAC